LAFVINNSSASDRGIRYAASRISSSLNERTNKF
jgi:hypothetical protein